MRSALTSAIGLLVLTTVGCGPEEARGRWQTDSNWSTKSGTTVVRGDVHCIGRNDEILLILLADSRWDPRITTTLSGSGLKGKGELPSVNGQQQTFAFDSTKTGTGELTIGNDKFDLSKGQLILLRTKGGPLASEQLDRDLQSFLMRDASQQGPSYTIDVERVTEFAATDAKLREFLKLEPAQAAP